jgi:hypothetical protein
MRENFRIAQRLTSITFHARSPYSKDALEKEYAHHQQLVKKLSAHLPVLPSITNRKKSKASMEEISNKI